MKINFVTSCLLPVSFFTRPTLIIAQELIGKVLVRRYRGFHHTVLITEVEAYDGPEDKASHAHRGPTPRNAVMFETGGLWYVYLVYGMHWMLNIVTGQADYPAAVLIRGIHELPTSLLRKNEKTYQGAVNGPARITKILRINHALDGQRADYSSGLWIEDRGINIAPSHLRRLPRIGVDYAGPWAKKPFRFLIESNRMGYLFLN